MLEALNNSENHVNNTENDTKFPKFNPDKARRLREEYYKKNPGEKPKSTGQEVPFENPERKPVEELTPQEASKEYLDLLMDLSSNFTSFEGRSSRPMDYEPYGAEKTRIVEQIYNTATGKNFYNEAGKYDRGKWEDKYIDREFALNIADEVILAESDWRAAGESTTIEAEQAKKAPTEQKINEAKNKLDKIEHGHGIFGKLRKFYHQNIRNREYYELWDLAHSQTPLTEAEENTIIANRNLQKALEKAYDFDPRGDHYRHTYQGDRYALNSEYNDRFFDKNRQEKIDRAIELRRKLEEKGIINFMDKLSLPKRKAHWEAFEKIEEEKEWERFNNDLNAKRKPKK